MTGNLTVTLVGDSASPGNSMLYGTNSSGVRGWYSQPTGGSGGGTTTIAKFHVGDGNPPASDYAYFGTRDSGGLGVWQFAHGGVDTSVVFCDITPQGATFTTGIQIIIYWFSTTATGRHRSIMSMLTPSTQTPTEQL
jgi:hypothetical protein